MSPDAPPRLLAAQDVSVTFGSGRRRLHAVDGISLSLSRGQTLAVVGESGSGKSTLAFALMRARRPDSGRILFEGADITRARGGSLRSFRRRVQMVFQDPYSSLDPRMSVERIIAEPLRAHGVGSKEQIRERVLQLLTLVGLGPEVRMRRPSQFSGGQRQRIAIARAMALDPDVLIADEPVSALDVSIQAQIVNLLGELRRERGIASLIISHDMALVYHLADRVAVMYLGRVVEEADCDDLVSSPQHPYTAALLSATPTLGEASRRERIVLRGSPPSALDRPTGCSFHPRCPIAVDRCRVETPPLAELGNGRKVACFFPGELPGPQLIEHTTLRSSP
ncbi:oligopeptide/dipeptide ABC transporter ATP-binding protein [Nocardiopsis sp. ATB16-24]|uniref:ABC transporter ATP-binding protein n=1 Tax=Nocardiopsis sp. ATB16-24 TaxID=3019555 RepID=UPI0025557746|nr:oligopeptide/dipeptide ABC transporter ATP-binding protein [Nocardiopsis sp. ATB16-24]